MDGKLRLKGGSTIQGDGVGFVFVGDKATLSFSNDSTVSLSAPADGPMAGILAYAQPSKKKERDFKIESKNARKLIGTVYLPIDNLVIGGDKDGDGNCDAEIEDDGSTTPAGPECLSDVGVTSAWTAIVANELKVTAGSNLVLHSDYAASKIPVPVGLGETSGKLVLVK